MALPRAIDPWSNGHSTAIGFWTLTAVLFCAMVNAWDVRLKYEFEFKE